jgi:hypothetical protein
MSLSSPRIIHLRFACGPPAILGLVIAIIIFAIQRIFYPRLVAHIFKKILKRMEPAVTDLDSARSVITIVFVSWI